MTAFALPSIVIVRGTKCHAAQGNSTSLFPRVRQKPKRQRAAESYFCMDNSEKESSKRATENNVDEGEEEEDDERLQKDPVYVYREFGKVSSVAILIGLVLFFYDILVSLWVTTIGLLYALAVLFEVKAVDSLFANILKSSVKLWSSFTDGVRKGWTTLTREVRKGLKD